MARTTTKKTEPAAAEPETPVNEIPDDWWEKHRAEVIARLPKEDERPKNIYGRLAQINGYIGVIKKRGYNDFHKYPYAKEEDLVEEIRPMLSEYGIYIEQSLAGQNDDPGFVTHQRLPQFKTRDNVTVDSLSVITKKFRFVWWNPEGIGPVRDVPGHPEAYQTSLGALEATGWVYFMGYGDDTGDKGYNKAETSAVKYFLMKTFMVATGNDPEGDKSVDERAARREAGPVEVRRAQGRPAQPGGRQQQTSSPQTRQIGELLRANGVGSSAEAIATLEAITGDTIPVPQIDGEPDLPGALAAYTASLTGEKAGSVVRQLREMAGAAAGAKAKDEAKPAAATWTDDESEAPAATTKVWSEEASDTTEAAGEDAGDGTIDNAIA